MPENIYVHKNGKNYGPMTAEDTLKGAKSGEIDAGDLIWTGKTGQWIRAADIPILAEAFESAVATVEYYVRVNEETLGPLAKEEIVRMINGGLVMADNFVWVPGEKRWKKAGELPDLAAYLSAVVPKKITEAEIPKPLAREEEFKAVERKYEADYHRDKAMVRTVDDDRNFLKTLVFVSLLYVLVILSVNFVYVPKTEEDTTLEIFRRVAKLVVDKTIDLEPLAEETVVTDVAVGVGTDGGSGGADGGTGGGEPGGDDFAATGIVGLITSLGGTGTVVDMIGAGGDLDLTISGIGGLKTGGNPTLGTGGGLGSGLGPGGGLGTGGGSGLGLLADKDKSLIGTTALKNARISTSPPSIRGSAVEHSKRSSAVIASIVNRHKTGIEYIYKKYLKTNPGMEGKIIIRFTIAASGAVTYAAVVSSTIGNPQFESEVASRVMTWRFPEIEAGDVTVEYPFVFFSAGG